MVGPVANEKTALRARVRQQRRAMTAQQRADAEVLYQQHLTRLVEQHGARSVAAFLPTPLEPDIRGWLACARGRGIRVLLPVSRPDRTLDWVDSDGATERVGELGVPEPVGTQVGADALGRVDLVLVPAAAVDRAGIRLGWGLGYYDRALESVEPHPPVYAVVFDAELLDTVPREPHDVPVDGAVTPGGVVLFRADQ